MTAAPVARTPARRLVVSVGEIVWDVHPDAAYLGGAPANFACHAAAAGAEAWLVSAVGADERGTRAREQLRRHGVRVDLVARDAAHRTGEVHVTLDAEKRPAFAIAADAAWDHVPWTETLGALVARCDALCFGTLGQRSPGSRDTIQRALHDAPSSALKMFDVNLRQHFHDAALLERSLELASALKMNEDELPVIAALCGIRAHPAAATLKAIARRYGLRLVALTRGPAGSILVAGDEESVAEAPPVRVVDTVGAGDAFTATLVCDYLAGQPLAEVNRHANAVAAQVCTIAGAVKPSQSPD